MKRLLDLILSLGVLAALAALVWAAVGAPLHDWRAAMLDDRAARITEAERLTDRIALLRVEAAQFDSEGTLDALWRGDQSGAVTALVQSTLSRIARENGVAVRTIAPTPARDRMMTETAGFRLEMEATLDQLAAFLREVEYGSPAMLVDRGVVRRLNRPGTATEQPLVFAQVEIVAPYTLGGAKPEDRP